MSNHYIAIRDFEPSENLYILPIVVFWAVSASCLDVTIWMLNDYENEVCKGLINSMTTLDLMNIVLILFMIKCLIDNISWRQVFAVLIVERWIIIMLEFSVMMVILASDASIVPKILVNSKLLLGVLMNVAVIMIYPK